MLKKRLIPTILLQNGQLVKSIGFKEYQIIGNPKVAIQFFNAWAVDEIVFLDISKTQDYTSIMRQDYNFKTLDNFVDIVRECATICTGLSRGEPQVFVRQIFSIIPNKAQETRNDTWRNQELTYDCKQHLLCNTVPNAYIRQLLR